MTKRRTLSRRHSLRDAVATAVAASVPLSTAQQAEGGEKTPAREFKSMKELLARMGETLEGLYPAGRYGYLPYYVNPKMPIYVDKNGRLRVKAGRKLGGDGLCAGGTDCADRAWLSGLAMARQYRGYVTGFNVQAITIPRRYGRTESILSHWAVSPNLKVDRETAFPLVDSTPLNATIRETHPPVFSRSGPIISEPIPFTPDEYTAKVSKSIGRRADPYVDGYLPLRVVPAKGGRKLLSEGGIVDYDRDKIVYGLNVAEYTPGRDPAGGKSREIRISGDEYNAQITIPRSRLKEVREKLRGRNPSAVVAECRRLGLKVEEVSGVAGKPLIEHSKNRTMKPESIREIRATQQVLYQLILKTPDKLPDRKPNPHADMF